MITVTINKEQFNANPESTILETCKKNGIYVPTLCYYEGTTASSKCGLCTVKVDGASYSRACITNVRQSMVIDTNTPDVIEKSQKAFEEIMQTPFKGPSTEIEEIAQYLYAKKTIHLRKSETTNSVKFDPDACIHCQRCVRICADTQQIAALSDNSQRLRNNSCINCGLCTVVCPTDAFLEAPSSHSVLRALGSGMTLVMIISPASIAAIQQMYPNKPDIEGSIISAARIMGFQYVFCSSSGADVTVYEESSEFIERLDKREGLPLFSSNCPAWVTFIEKSHPELISHLTPVKSPHVVLSRMIKTRVTHLKNMDPSKLHFVSLLPCTAAKDEIKRMQLQGEINTVLTTREFLSLIGQFGVDLSIMKSGSFDPPYNSISKTSVMDEIPGRHISFILKASYAEGDTSVLVNQKGIAEGNFVLNGKSARIAVCNGIGSARDLIESGKYHEYSYIEVYACPNGCAGGGGQPRTKSMETINNRVLQIMKFSDKFPELGTLPLTEPMFRTHFEPQESAIMHRYRRQNILPLVAYGSAMGHAKQYARIFSTSSGCQSIPMNQLDITEIKNNGCIIFFIATTGDGDFPLNAERFYFDLEKDSRDLAGVNYAICALGSTNFENFCLAGKKLQKLLESKGAKQLIPMILSNAATMDRGMGEMEKWTVQLSALLHLRPPKFVTKLKYNIELSDDKSIVESPLRPKGFEIAELVGSTRMTPPNIQPPMHRYVVKLPQGMDYEAGDHFSILPENPVEITEEVIKALKLDPKEVYIVTPTTEASLSFIPQRISIGQLFGRYLDLCGPTDKSLILAFHDYGEESLQQELQKYIQNDNALLTLSTTTTCAEFIINYASKSQPPLDRLISSCPHIQPRVFSIASAPSTNRGYLELLVHSVLYGPKSNRKGLTTYYLQKEGLKYIAVQSHKGIFRYPSDLETPIIFCAIGSGLAPFEGILFHRKYLLEKGMKIGPALLFFGARYQAAFPLLMKKLATLLECKAVDKAFAGFSRDGPKHVHIQDLMNERSQEIWDLWKNPKTKLFYCGPRRAIPDDIREIMIETTMKEGKMPREMAESFSQSHSFVMESYG